MKTSYTVIGIIVVVLIGIFAFVSYQGKNETPLSEQTPSITGCYVATLSKDVYTLTILSQQGESVEGTLSFKNFEKDSSSGTFEGTYKDGILLGDYSFQSEGMNSVMQVIFKKSADGFMRGYGDMNSAGDRFADIDKITYDSSYVFRPTSDCTGTSSLDTSTWKTFSGSAKGITFKYPETIPTTYIHTVDWPPKVEITTGAFSCVEAGNETSVAGKTTKETINGRQYCLTKETEGAAGSIYTQYAYATQVKDKVAFVTFSIRAVQCANYEDPQKTACEKERSVFSIDPIVDQIVQTISFL